ncbi:MAG: efflux transporter outer membrane subunit [Planctomycetes bacterium]|nr:efflux transporter outer membrane subunit [Planctomycetota bacterium]
MSRRAALTSFLLAACATEPPPRVDLDHGVAVPATFAGATADAAPEPDRLEDGWWQAFGDPRLDAMIVAALEHNRDLRAAAARLTAAASSRTIAAAGALPQLDANLTPQRSRRIFVGFPFGGGGVPSSTSTTWGLGLNLRWELDLWGRIRSGEAAAIADVQAAAADHAAARLSLAGQVCKAWFAAIEAGQQLALAQATAKAFRQTAEDVRDRFQRGVRPAIDVHLALTSLHNAEASVAQRREQYDAARRVLELLTGRYPAASVALSAALPERVPTVPLGLPSDLMLRRPDLVAAERRLAAAGCRVDAARAALYPKLSLTASGGTTSEDLEDLIDTDFRVWSLGANLLQPLFQGGALRADVARNEARLAESLALYGGTMLMAFAEVENALATQARLTERSDSLTAAATHAARAHELARDRWQSGLADFLLVADGQRQSFQSESARLLMQRLRLDNHIDLILSLGGGFAADAEPADDDAAGAEPGSAASDNSTAAREGTHP